MLRKIKREHLKKKVGADNMTYAWEYMQQKKYGKMYHSICRGSRKRNKN